MTAQEEYLTALKYQQSSTVGSGDDMLASVKRRLSYWDISDAEIKALEQRGKPNKIMTVYSPASGYVIDKMVLKGTSIMPGMTLYKISNLSNIWVYADVYEYELPWVKLGDDAEITLSYLPDRVFNGKITYIDSHLDG